MIEAASVRRYADLLVRFPGAPEIRTGVLVQALAAPAGEMLFRLLDWGWLQLAMRSAVVGAGILTGAGTMELEGTLYRYGGFLYEVTERCTYADFLCLTTPLILRLRSSREDLLRVGAWWLGVLIFCLLRIILASELRALGVPWVLGHDTIDYAFRIAALLAVIYAFLSARLGHQRDAAKRCPM